MANQSINKPVSISSVSLRGVKDGEGRAELGVQGPAKRLMNINLFCDTKSILIEIQCVNTGM